MIDIKVTLTQNDLAELAVAKLKGTLQPSALQDITPTVQVQCSNCGCGAVDERGIEIDVHFTKK